jgi:hypothetical protein
MAHLTDEEIQKVFDDYNRLRARNDYWVGAGMALVEYLHKELDMSFAEIYTIAESPKYTQEAKARVAACRMEGNVVTLPVVRVQR